MTQYEFYELQELVGITRATVIAYEEGIPPATVRQWIEEGYNDD